MLRAEHMPLGPADCCGYVDRASRRCGLPHAAHRVDHAFVARDDLASASVSAAAAAARLDRCARCGLPRRNHHDEPMRHEFIAVDGEGQGRDPHRYVMLCAANASGGLRKVIEAPEDGRLSTTECLDFLLSLGDAQNTSVRADLGDAKPSRDAVKGLPRRRRSHHGPKIVSFSFGYDLTMILWDLPDSALYKLYRPELRARAPDDPQPLPVPVRWGRYKLNLVGRRFSVSSWVKRPWRPGSDEYVWWQLSATVNDIFAFFGSKFVTALDAWKAPTTLSAEERRRTLDLLAFFESKIELLSAKERKRVRGLSAFFQERADTWDVAGDVSAEERKSVLALMSLMKDKREQFDLLPREEIRGYCWSECQGLAELGRKLQEAHVRAGIPLDSYYGAGSSGKAMLKRMGIQPMSPRHDKPELEAFFGHGENVPREMLDAIACAFFGGRFEHSIVGSIPDLVHSYDINSAYPYQSFLLPCLVCGRWEFTRDRARVETARTALVHYGLGRAPRRGRSAELLRRWAPFPFRERDGSIVFPRESTGGWVWRDEFLAGERLYSHVEFRGAWVYECDCEHRPFAMVPEIYLERLRLGPDGQGLSLKLGLNSGCYGVLAQSVGAALYQSWIWAGLITSGCRAQILSMLALHRDPGSLLAVATDGIYSREDLACPIPLDTGTDVDFTDPVTGKAKRKPLGGWGHKLVKRGMFFARPGIYFPLHTSEQELEELVRARGVGRTEMVRMRRAVIQAYERGEPKVTVGKGKRSLSRFWGAKSCISVRTEDGRSVYERSKRYGTWEPHPVDLTFGGLPKRQPDSRQVSGEPYAVLAVRTLPRVGAESTPYSRSLVSDDAWALRNYTEMELEQPDADLSWDYDEF